MTKLHALIISSFLAAFSTVFSVTAEARDAHQPGTVVELYTSQGCSSCPPADALMGKLVQNPDVLGLSFSVTYWDYIGWPDTFGDIKNDERQTRYREKLDTRYVYTPQMIIAGQDHFVGSNQHELEENLIRFKDHAGRVKLKWRFTDTHLEVDLPQVDQGAVIWQMDLDRENEVQIRRGENRGKSVSYHNVVRKIQMLERWDGSKQILKLDLGMLAAAGRDGCAVILQKDGFGPIIAALVINL